MTKPIGESALGALHQPINILKLPQKGLAVKIDPDESVREELAAQLGVSAVETLKAVLLVKKWHKDGVKVTGELHAQIVQNCVVTLNPVTQEIAADINAVYVPATSRLAKPKLSGDDNELIIDPEGDDVPEIFYLPELDVGNTVSEFLALEIDEYPRAEGVTDVSVDYEPDDEKSENDKENPFAALSALKNKL